jgi:uncharacterized phage-associated protein
MNKLEEALLFLAKLYENDPYAGRKRLHKVLFFADMEAKRELGYSITGETYLKYDHGPFMPALDRAVDRLKMANAGHWDQRENSRLIRLVVYRDADSRAFDEGELEILRQVGERYRNWPGFAIEEAAHRHFGWLAVRNGSEIPDGSAYIGEVRQLSLDENQRALEAIQRYRERKRAASEYCP